MSQHLDQWVDQLVLLLDDMVGGLTVDQQDAVARAVLAGLHLWGEELVGSLDPPAGLRRWLESHGLSLVPTHEPVKPRAWDEVTETVREAVQTEKEQVRAHVFDSVSFRTTPSGPRQESLMGSGQVSAVLRTHEDKLVYSVRITGTQRLVHVCPADGDEMYVQGTDEVAT